VTLLTELTLLNRPVVKTGDTMSGSLVLNSTFAGSFDTFDSTSRLTVQSWQTGGNHAYAEGLRMDLMRATSKNMIAWRLPRPPTTGDPATTMRTVTWAGAHYYAQDQIDLNNPIDIHGHWSIEVPDAADALRTRFEIKFVDAAGALGLDKTLVQTASADLVVDCSNSQVLRLRSGAGAEKAIEFGNEQWGTLPRWKVLQNGTAESGGNVGSDFEIRRHSDAGAGQGSPIRIARTNGRVTIGDTDGAQTGLDVNRNSAGATIQVTNTANGGTGVAFKANDLTSRAIQSLVTTDPVARVVVYADGKNEWGDGTNPRDTNLYRSAAGVLKTDTALSSANLLATANALGIVTPANHGLTAWTYDPILAASSSVLTGGVVYLAKIHVALLAAVTKIYWSVATAGATPTSAQNEVGLYDSTGAKLASTNVDSSVASTAGIRTTTIASQSLLTGAFYWAAFLFNAATNPALSRSNSVVSSNLVNVGLATAVSRGATYGTAQTALPASLTAASLIPTPNVLWAAVAP
jgi:hypothetical protein